MIAAPAGETQGQHAGRVNARQRLVKIRALLLGHMYKGPVRQRDAGVIRDRIEIADNRARTVSEAQGSIRAAIGGHEFRGEA